MAGRCSKALHTPGRLLCSSGPVFEDYNKTAFGRTRHIPKCKLLLYAEHTFCDESHNFVSPARHSKLLVFLLVCECQRSPVFRKTVSVEIFTVFFLVLFTFYAAKPSAVCPLFCRHCVAFCILMILFNLMVLCQN